MFLCFWFFFHEIKLMNKKQTCSKLHKHAGFCLSWFTFRLGKQGHRNTHTHTQKRLKCQRRKGCGSHARIQTVAMMKEDDDDANRLGEILQCVWLPEWGGRNHPASHRLVKRSSRHHLTSTWLVPLWGCNLSCHRFHVGHGCTVWAQIIAVVCFGFFSLTWKFRSLLLIGKNGESTQNLGDIQLPMN